MDSLKDIIDRQQRERPPHDDPLTDRLLAEIVRLAEEVCVLRDRLDTCERLAAAGQPAVGTQLASAPTYATINTELSTYVDDGTRPDNLIDRLLAGPSDTRAIAKGVCAAVLGSASTLIQ